MGTGRERRTVLILGLGLHGGGLAAANHFGRLGDRVIVSDLKPLDELGPSVEKLHPGGDFTLALGGHRYEDVDAADLVVKNPAVPADSPLVRYARSRGKTVDSDVGIFLRQVRGRTHNIVGVTGTKGKSTTSALIHAMIRRRYGDAVLCGNITVPALDVLERVGENTFVVIELSSFQLKDIAPMRFSPPAAVFTNFMPDHLDRYADMETYFRDKSVIYRHQSADDLLVLNRDDARLRDLPDARGRVIGFGMGEAPGRPGAFIRGEEVWFRADGAEEEPVLPLGGVPLWGLHNRLNLLAAVAAVKGLGIDTESVRRGAGEFGGLPHRMEKIGEIGGVLFVNDSAATTPDAAIAALETCRGDVTLIAGGSDKKLPLEDLAEAVNRRVASLALLSGSGTDRFLGHGVGVAHRVFDDLREAVEWAVARTGTGGTVLLSPGFASFGMFKNEFDRGNRFRDLVKSRMERRHRS